MRKLPERSLLEEPEELSWTRTAGSRGPFIHNVVAALFAVCLASGVVLGSGYLEGALGHREVFRELHVVSGLAALGVGLAGLSRLGGRRMSVMARQLRSWRAEDQVWFETWKMTLRRPDYGHTHPNAGQKVAFSAMVASMIVLAVTGLILRFFSFFPLWVRSGATLAHAIFFYLLTVLILAHISYALVSRRRS